MSDRPFLLIDCGASRVKAAAYDRSRGALIAFAEAQSPVPMVGGNGEVEVAADAHPALVKDLAEQLSDKIGKGFEAAVVCTEMHGFLLADGDGRPLTQYVSWRDGRGGRVGVGGEPSTLDTLRPGFEERFRAETGMRMKSGLPFVTLAHMARTTGLPREAHLLSLGEWIVTAAGGSYDRAHETIAAASGLYDIYKGEWSPALLGELGISLHCNHVITDMREPIGWLDCRGDRLPVHGGVGDMQAAVFGAGTPVDGALCVNLGTGSQVSVVGLEPAAPAVEVRPYFDGMRLATISHIPSGRAFRVFEQFFDEIAGKVGTGESAFWPLVAALSEDEVESAPLSVDLNVFDGSWRYSGGGGIAAIREGMLSARSFAASLVRAYIGQYVDAIEIMDPARTCGEIVLAGGMPRRIGVLASLLGRHTGRVVKGPFHDEETLVGLGGLAGQLEPRA